MIIYIFIFLLDAEEDRIGGLQ